MTTIPLTAVPATRRRRLRERWDGFGRAPRLMGVDVARALAVFGMIGAHAGIASAWGEAGGPDPLALVNGRSSILFAVVAGISVALATGGRDLPSGEALRSARLRLAGRALAVLAIGLALELLGSDIAVILPVYGILFLVLIPFVGMRRRTVALTAVVLALAGPTLVALLRFLALGSSGAGVQFLVSGSYPMTVWLPLLLAGLAVGRCALAEARVAWSVLGGGAALTAIGYGVGDAANASVRGWLDGWGSSSAFPSGSAASSALSSGAGAGSWPGSTGTAGGSDAAGAYLDRLASTDLGTSLASAWGVAPHSGGTWEILGSGGLAFAVVGACLLLARPLRIVLVPVAAVGSMPLTAYAAHVISFAVLISPFALAPGVVPWQSGGTGTLFWLACLAVLLVACTAWALTRGRGPLESLTAGAARRMDRPVG